MANLFTNKKRIIATAGIALAVIATVIVVPMTTTNVKAGEYKIVQTIGGDLKVLNTPGFKFIGLTTDKDTYREGDTLYFSDSDLDGGAGAETVAIEVIFRDGAKGKINGNIQYRLPISEEERITLHKLYGRDYKTVVHSLIRKSVAESIIQSATYYKGEEAYTYGRSEFVSLIQKQLEQGIYATIKDTQVVQDAEGNDFVENIVKVKEDTDGNPIIQKEAKFNTFGVDIIGFNVEGINLDSKTMAYIEKKKDAEFQKIQAQAEAESAKQDAITAEAKGKAKVAQAKADADVEKQKAVTLAEQKREVAELEKQQKQLETEAMLIEREAEAKANTLKVKAGLTPQERLAGEIQMNKDKYEALAKANTPSVVINGSESGDVSPLTFMGVNAALDMVEKADRLNK